MIESVSNITVYEAALVGKGCLADPPCNLSPNN